MIKLTIFDLDDTLFNSTELSTQARRNAVRAMIDLGLPATFEEAYQVLSEVVEEYGSNYGHHFDQMLKRLNVESDKLKLYVSAGMIAYHDVKYANIRPFHDVIPTFIRLKKLEVKICILSDGDAIKQYEKILRLRLQDFLDDIIITEEVGIRKPNPKLFELPLKRAKVQPNEAIYIGDNYERDIVPCIKIGIKTVLIHRGGKYDQSNMKKRSPPPDYEIYNLNDLVSIIEKINLNQ
ncbi:MAG: TIGR02253 family HAD-type hydrolase [Candidatus Helarchaeota archaeon]